MTIIDVMPMMGRMIVKGITSVMGFALKTQFRSNKISFSKKNQIGNSMNLTIVTFLMVLWQYRKVHCEVSTAESMVPEFRRNKIRFLEIKSLSKKETSSILALPLNIETSVFIFKMFGKLPSMNVCRNQDVLKRTPYRKTIFFVCSPLRY
jgi:hypothetical protein